MSSTGADTNRRVLVIDDNVAIHEDFRKILSSRTDPALDATEAAVFGPAVDSVRQTGFAVDSAYQGSEGMLMVKKNIEARLPYAMAFVDVRMPPGWDGIETSGRIWQIDPDLQIVICTAYTDYSWEEMVGKLGYTDRLLILKKPFEAVEVVQLASALTEKWRLHQEAKNHRFPKLLAGLQPVQAFDQNETLAVAPHQDGILLTILQNILGQFVDGFRVERRTARDRHVDVCDRE